VTTKPPDEGCESNGAVLEHSGRYNLRDCPCLGCSGRRDTRCQIDFADGQRQVVTACERHITLYAARGVARAREMRGDVPLALLDDAGRNWEASHIEAMRAPKYDPLSEPRCIP
jgi:hypothetical protein